MGLTESQKQWIRVSELDDRSQKVPNLKNRKKKD